MRHLPMLAWLLAGSAAGAAPAPGDQYRVDERCVTVTRVQGDQVYYAWRAGNASGSGNLPADDLGARCQAPAAPDAPQPSAPRRPPGLSGHGAPPPAGFAQAILQAHNRLRCQHGAPPLQWRNDMAAYAQAWLMSGRPGHSDSYRSPLGRMGENLAGGTAITGPMAVQMWYDESQGYDYRRRPAGGRMTGHFTAMIWKDAGFVGCALVRDAVSCNYAAASPEAACGTPNFNLDRCALSQVLAPTRRAQDCL